METGPTTRNELTPGPSGDRRPVSGTGPEIFDLSVVVPVFNEAGNIVSLVAEIRASLDGFLDYEIIYVDDGSHDETPGRLKEVASDFTLLHVIRHRVTCGQSTAMMTGVRTARAPLIVTLDGDGQNDPADIPRLWECFRKNGGSEGSLLVVGHRQKRKDTRVKRMSSKIANTVRSRLLKDDTPDTGSGIKMFSRETFLELPYFDHMHRFIPALVLRNGGRVVSLAVNHRQRKHGKSKYGLHNRLWVGIIDMLGVMWLQRRAKLPVIEKEV